MIETYWEEMFGEFKVGEGAYAIPGFSEPLMSPHFGVKNIIGGDKGKMKLCYFPKMNTQEILEVSYETLTDAISSREFWEFQESFNKEGQDFMKKLLPFLVFHKKPHTHFFLKEDGELIASGIVGRGKTTAFLFNLSVKEGQRGNGLAKKLFHGIRENVPSQLFYWTWHPWFTLGAPLVLDYDLK